MKNFLITLIASTFLLIPTLFITKVVRAAQSPVKAITPHIRASSWPDRIIVTPTPTPASSFSVTWRTDKTVKNTHGQIVKASPNARYDVNAKEFSAKTYRTSPDKGINSQGQFSYPSNTGLPIVSYHSLTFYNLQADTNYNYRVEGASGKWSPWQQIKTAPTNTEQDFEFLYFGDAQNGIYSHWPLMLRHAWQHAPKAKFAVYAGDLVNEGASDQQWSNWLNAGQFIHRSLPAVLVAGNHEYDWQMQENKQKNWALSTLWQDQFTLPLSPSLPKALQETAYVTHYPDLDVFVLDSEAQGNIALLQAQATWLDRKLQNSSAKWRIVTLHHPIFSSCGMPLGTAGQDEPDVRAAFLPIMLKHNVDLVLQGHDHAYSRGSIGTEKDLAIAASSTSLKQVKSVFVTTVAGPKTYPVKPTRWDEYRDYGVTLERIGENTPTYQIVKKSNQQLSYQAFMGDGTLYDAFTLTKNKAEGKTIIVANDLPPERMFNNTGLYKTHYDLAE
ncbi:purple acid phosphatase family protein [Paraglaciecola polaris]|uniref:Metallophosphoesterase n=1 Tax=Paraglaciecola polaris LMG 21857 TaxID=1129793 RepID=K7ADK6_9ALTE|nr:metallophosphoesterase family protein [Paraglaciecola polaris]GAC33395.1 metallophosphoesterase [Paraglaciecola polaris LMG 21857]